MEYYIYQHAQNHCHRVDFSNISLQELVRRCVAYNMEAIAERDIGPMIPDNATYHIVNCFGFEDPASWEFAKHVGLHPGILLGCYNHHQFTPLVQWIVSRIADAGIGDDAPPHVVVFVCKSGTHRSVALATLFSSESALPAWGPFNLCSSGWSTRCYGRGCQQCSRIKESIHGQVLARAVTTIRSAFDKFLREHDLYRQMHLEERRQVIETSNIIQRVRSTAAACQARIPGHSAGPAASARPQSHAPQASQEPAPVVMQQPPLKPPPTKPRAQGVTLAQVQSGQVLQPAAPSATCVCTCYPCRHNTQATSRGQTDSTFYYSLGPHQPHWSSDGISAKVHHSGTCKATCQHCRIPLIDSGCSAWCHQCCRHPTPGSQALHSEERPC
eukprot:2225120-Amphidinium_carterae.2